MQPVVREVGSGPLGELTGLTGRGVRVAVVDSGVEGCPTGVALRDTDVGIEEHHDLTDRLGHGTAAAGIVRFWAPECQLISVRILHESYQCSGRLARQGVQRAIELGADVVLLSLAGWERAGWDQVVEQAARAKTILVAASANGYEAGYPALLPGVLGVRASQDPGLFRWLDSPLELATPPQPVGGAREIKGTSASAAHAAGLVARLRELKPGLAWEGVRTFLQELCGRGEQHIKTPGLG